MTMKTYRFALIPQRRRQSLYRDYKKPVEHFLRVLLKEVGARPQRLEENNDHVYIRVLMPEGVNAQRAIAWVKRESAAALYARLKRTGCDVMYGTSEGKPDFWAPSHYMDTEEGESNRGDMVTFVTDELLGEQRRRQIADYAKKRRAAMLRGGGLDAYA